MIFFQIQNIDRIKINVWMLLDGYIYQKNLFFFLLKINIIVIYFNLNTYYKIIIDDLYNCK